MKSEGKINDSTYRKEVSLTHGVVEVLATLATGERRTLKNYMESVLINHAHEYSKTTGKIKANPRKP